MPYCRMMHSCFSSCFSQRRQRISKAHLPYTMSFWPPRKWYFSYHDLTFESEKAALWFFVRTFSTTALYSYLFALQTTQWDSSESLVPWDAKCLSLVMSSFGCVDFVDFFSAWLFFSHLWTIPRGLKKFWWGKIDIWCTYICSSFHKSVIIMKYRKTRVEPSF